MTRFILAAAFMAALAAAAVAVPLLRSRGSRLTGALAAVLIAGAAAALYPMWSNWNWHPAAGSAAAPDVLAMVAKLDAHLRENPKDLEGWLMLGRSYVALERPEDAAAAYGHAHDLDPTNADAALGLGEAMSLKAGGNITPAAGELFEQALAVEPSNPRALLYGGFAAAVRGDYAAARARWTALKALHPPAEIDTLLDARIAELGPSTQGTPTAAASQSSTGAVPGPGTPGRGAAGSASRDTAGPRTAETPDTAAGGNAVLVRVTISIAPALKARLTQEAPLFVFAREPGAGGPPLAAKRLTSAAIGTQIQLSAADSMIPGRVLQVGHPVSITARVSFSGQPLPAAGDLYGELRYDVGHDGARDLVIDRVAD